MEDPRPNPLLAMGLRWASVDHPAPVGMGVVNSPPTPSGRLPRDPMPATATRVKPDERNAHSRLSRPQTCCREAFSALICAMGDHGVFRHMGPRSRQRIVRVVS